MSNQAHTNTSSNPREDMDSVLHSFLGWLAERFKESAKDAGDSQSLLGIGLKTQFAQEWETFLHNPVDSMYQAKQSIDVSLQKVINVMVSTFLKSKANLISKVLWAQTGNNTMYYCISLKEDTLENRIAINDFFDFYDDYALSSNYPVYFQFVPEKYISQIKYQQEIV